jgi:hypothetical protein
VGSESSSGYVDNYGSSLDTTGPTVTSVSTTADNQSAVSITDNITVTFSEAMDNTSYKYKYIDELLSWENANNYCAEQGGHLPALNSAEEHSMLSELCFSNSGNEDCWIGLNDIDLEDDFQWANGTAYPADGYTFNWTWNRADRDCFVLEGYYHNGSIEGDFCNSAKNFLCENPLPPSVTTNTDNTSCYGTLRVSSDNFSSCVQMASSPSISNSDMTFTLDPSDNLTGGTTYKTRVTTGVKDAAGNSMSSQYETSSGFTTLAPTVLYETTTPTRLSNNIVYSQNNSTSYSDSDLQADGARIGYRMEVTNNGTDYYAETIFDAWDGITLSSLLFPTVSNENVIQRTVTNMSVASNYPTVTNTSSTTGRLEIWPWNYSATAQNNIGGDNSKCDFDDTHSGNQYYGSMQVHNLSAAQTVMAWNRHYDSDPDIGFGNNPANTGDNKHPDWTFSSDSSLGTSNWKFQVLLILQQ